MHICNVSSLCEAHDFVLSYRSAEICITMKRVYKTAHVSTVCYVGIYVYVFFIACKSTSAKTHPDFTVIRGVT